MTKFQQVINILKQKGMSDDKIADFAANLTKTNFTRVYAEAMSEFKEEDLSAIDAASSQSEANQMIAKLYQLRIGKDIHEEVQRFLDVFCDGFLKEYEKEKSAAAG